MLKIARTKNLGTGHSAKFWSKSPTKTFVSFSFHFTNHFHFWLVNARSDLMNYGSHFHARHLGSRRWPASATCKISRRHCVSWERLQGQMNNMVTAFSQSEIIGLWWTGIIPIETFWERALIVQPHNWREKLLWSKNWNILGCTVVFFHSGLMIACCRGQEPALDQPCSQSPRYPILVGRETRAGNEFVRGRVTDSLCQS